MPTGWPTSLKMKVKFDGVTLVDVSADVERDRVITISSRGRTNPTVSSQSPAQTQIVLDNGPTCSTGAGSYTPRSQVLTDGTTTNPYWPNIIPKKLLQISYFVASTEYVRFVGEVTNWAPTPTLDSPQKWDLTTVTAIDRSRRFTKTTLKSPLLQEASEQATLVCLYPLTEAVGATSALDYTGMNRPLVLAQTGTGGTLVFGDTGPGFGDGTGVKLTPSTTSNGLFLQGAAALSTLGRINYTMEGWLNTAAVPAAPAGILASLDWGASFGSVALQLNTSGFAQLVDTMASLTVTGAVNLADSGWHHVAVTHSGSIIGPTGTATLYVDGVSVGSGSAAYGVLFNSPTLRVGQSAAGAASALFKGNLGYVAVYGSALSAATILQHFQAGRGYVGDTTDVRINRWLTGAAALAAGDINLDTGVATVNTYPQAGQTVLQACEDMTTTESGGSAFYIAPDGRARFMSRHYRKPGAPVMTLNALTDILGQPWLPAMDADAIVNNSTGSRASESGTQATVSWTDDPSTAAFGPAMDGGFTSYALSTDDVRQNAQWRVAVGRTPAFRLAQVTVDLVASETNLWAILPSVEIGSRIRVTNIPFGAAPWTQIDLIVEGWTETITPDRYLVTFDTSPADNPPFLIWGGTSDSSRWQASGQTLNTTITNAGTTVIITTAAGNPTLTTVSARYPMNVQIDEEIMTFTVAPGATSPQTFTAVTRGVNGTKAAAHTAGAVFNLYPANTWAL